MVRCPALLPLPALAGRAWMLPLLGLVSCAAPRDGSLGHPSWPYTQIRTEAGIPTQLSGLSLFYGRWIAADPERGTVLAESSDPRFLLRLGFALPREYRVLDLGAEASVETLAFLDRGRAALLVGSVGDAQHGTSIYSRALLRFDLEQNLLVDSIPLRREDLARGLALDFQEGRAYLFLDDGAGNGSVDVMDLYAGRSRIRRETGSIPAGVRRKGLVLERSGRTLFCLAGGLSARSDFEPVGTPPEPPGILALDAESLREIARIPLDEGGTPLAMVYDADQDRVVVLESLGGDGRLVIVDVGFMEVRDRVRLNDAVTDVTVRGGYAFLPGPRGIQVVDLGRAQVVGYAALPLDHTGEIAVSRSGERALVHFQGGIPGGAPGLAVVDLATGSLVDVLQ